MATSSASRTVSYTGNGATTAFSVTFKFFDSADLVVTTVSTADVTATLVEGTDYTVAGEGEEDGGTVTLTTAPATGYLVNIERRVGVTQPTSFKRQGRFDSESLEDALDRLTQIAQQQRDDTDDLSDTLASLASSDTSAGLVIYASDYCPVDGVSSDTAGAVLAIAAAVSTGLRHVHFSGGTYIFNVGSLVNDTALLNIPSNFVVSGDVTATLKITGLTSSDAQFGHLFQVTDGLSNVTFDGLQITGENNPFTYIQNHDAAAIDIRGTLASPVADITVKNCVFSYLWGFSVHGRGEGDRVSVVDCITKYCANGINVNTDFSIIERNRMYSGEGLECSGKFSSYSHNVMRDMYGVGISAGGNESANRIKPGVVIKGNIIDGCTSGPGIILADACCDAVIDGNAIRRCDNGGILFNQQAGSHIVRGHRVTNNVCISNGIIGGSAVSGLDISGVGTCTISGNICRNDLTTVTTHLQRYGLKLAAPNCLVDGNYFEGDNSVQDMLVTSAATGLKLGQNVFAYSRVQFGATGLHDPEKRFTADATGYWWHMRVHSESNSDTFGRASFRNDGELSWGSGSATRDTNLYRGAANVLQTDDVMSVVGHILKFNSVSATTTLGLHGVLAVDATAAARTINLPTAVGIAGRMYKVIKIDASANAVNVTPNLLENINGANAVDASTTRWLCRTYVSDGAGWLAY